MSFFSPERGLRSRSKRWSDNVLNRSLKGVEKLEDKVVLSATVGDGMPVISFNADTVWNSGYTGNITIKNDEAMPIDDWVLEFDLEAKITSLWNGQIVSTEGDHYTVEHASWNDTIAPGASVSFGFVASGNVGEGAINFIFNGEGEDPVPIPVKISIDDATLTEGDSENLTAELTVSLSQAPTDTLTVDFRTANDTAIAGEDYQTTSGTLTFAAGETSKTIAVTVLGDTVEESDESFGVVLENATYSNAAGAVIVDAEGLVTIEDNDQTVPEGAGAVEFTVSSDWGSGFTGGITITNEDGTAWNDWTLEFDFEGSLTAVWNATVAEHNGDHYVIKPAAWNTSVAAGGTVSFGFNGARASSDIEPTNFVLNGKSVNDPTDPEDPDDPTTPSLSVEDVKVVEGNEGTTTVTMLVRLSEAADQPITVSYETTPGTATEGTDYLAASGSVTFEAGETEKEISVAIVGDTDYEYAESLSVLLATTVDGIEDAVGTITILNDDTNPNGDSDQRVIAYYAEWGIYDRDYQPLDIPADQLTHVIYAFAQIKDGEIAVYDSYAALEKAYPGDTWDQEVRGTFNQFRILKEENPDLNVLIAVGGWTLSGEFSNVALTEASREKFAASVVEFVTTYGFDGVDLDWEYPVAGGMGSNTYRPEDTVNYTLLVQELREQFDAQSAIDGQTYEITIAAPAGYDKIENFELEKMSQYVDWFNVMTYDYHGLWENTTNHNAPLYASEDDPSYFRDKYVIDYTIQSYLSAGVSPDQLVLGVPLYGYGWQGVGSENYGLYQSSTGAAPGTWEAGSYDYSHIVQLLEDYPESYSVHWDDEAGVPYVYSTANGGMFITFENEQSVQLKIDYVMEHELGGMFFWELSADADGDDSLVEQVSDALLMPV